MTRFAVGFSLLFVACSAEESFAARRPLPRATDGAATAGQDPGAPSSGFGNPGSGPASGVSGGMMMRTAAPIDASALAFKQDDTAASGLDPALLNQLRTAAGSCAVKVSYPYENTLFPGGLTPPVIMWEGASDAAYLRFQYEGTDKVDYEFAARITAPAQIQIPRSAWDEITRRTNRLPLNVSLNVSNAGVFSSCKLHWTIVPGNMTGALYYNTYQAPAPGVPGQGAVMRQTLGANAEIYKQSTSPVNAIASTGPCYSCHSVSFNGSTMVASYHDYASQVFRVEKFAVTQAAQPASAGMLDNANFGALTPDGKKILSMGNPQCTAGADSFPRKANNFPLVEGPAVARLLDTQTGADLHAKGLDPNLYMWMPQFSPDGKKVVFNHAKADGAGGTDRRELAVMDYDAATDTFSNLILIVAAGTLTGISAPTLAYSPAPAFGGVLSCGAEMCGPDGTPNSCVPLMGGAIPGLGGAIPGLPGDVAALPTGSCAGPCYPAWPFFTPDNKAVIFSMTSDPDFTQAFPGRDQPSKSELWYVDLQTLQPIKLDNANRGSHDIDAQNNYYPTVMPVAVGGYFWVFWTAVRDYGTKVRGRDPSGAPVVAAAEALKKRIWVAAIQPRVQTGEVQDPTLRDPSFPGFYLDGQSESGNVRAFATLNPCLDNGATCSSGLDCCCGYCLQPAGSQTGTCNCEVPECSKLNEKCSVDADCCPPERPEDPPLSCIGGFCSFVVVN